ncbi:MAG: BolA/IbaG family iron-sulfur metabolism protein [Betaproteobacteria bacterium]|nr:BolA/IbaG family iron-sulfur metabolism protein [Betaproteobacteria bacterium]
MRAWRLLLQPAQFAGKPIVARHRMVYFAPGEMLKQKYEIHALHITVCTPD